MTRLEPLLRGAPERPLYVFLDYDGTLAPIAERPENAVFDPAMRARLEQLSDRHRTAVISGRGLDDLVPRVALTGIFYAGSHGIELRHPDGHEERQTAAEAASDQLAALARLLEQRLGGIEGLQLERKRFGVAVHYRRAARAAETLVTTAVEEAAATFAGLKVKAGKKVFEFVPALDWDKGKALHWILAAAGLDRAAVHPLYIGDDLTDEDAFRAIDGWGTAIVVGDEGPRCTAAQLKLADIERLFGRR